MNRFEPKRGSLTVYMSLMVIIVLLMVMIRNCSSPVHSITDRRAGGDTLNIAMEISPIGVSTMGDTLCGYYYDMVRSLAETNDLTVKIDGFTDIAGVLRKLDEGRYDIVIADIPMTAELKDKYLFTIPVAIDRQILVQTVDSAGVLPIKSQQDLSGATVFLPANSPLKSRLKNLARELGDTIIIKEDPDYASEQLVMLTAIGEIPNAIVNRRLAMSMLDSYPNLDTSVEISFNQFQSWIVAQRDSLLLDSLNHWLETFKSTDRFESLNRRYMR